MRPDEYLVVDGLRVRYRVAGDGPPLLLIQGIGGSLELWDPLLAQLDAFTTIVFDNPGSGHSETPRRPLSMEDYARVATALLDHLGHERVDIIGFSFGGMVAQQLARSSPQRLRRLVLASTLCGMGSVPGGPAAIAAISTPYRFFSPSYFKFVAPVLYGGAVIRDTTLSDEQAAVRQKQPPSILGYLLQMLAVLSWSSLPWLHELRVPTLVLCGTDDPIAPIANSRRLAREVPGAELIEFPGAGHLLLMESAEKVAPHLTAFFATA
jgi:poly(3-hydroxyalkanoate) depolymerase